MDPFFQAMSAAFDEGGTGGLLLTQLRCLNSMSQLAFDSSTIVSPGGDDVTDDDRGASAIDLRDLRSEWYLGGKNDALIRVRTCSREPTNCKTYFFILI